MSIVKTQYLGGIFQKNDNISNEEKRKIFAVFPTKTALFRLNYAKTNDKPRLAPTTVLENVITTEFQTAKIKQTAPFRLNLRKNQR